MQVRGIFWCNHGCWTRIASSLGSTDAGSRLQIASKAWGRPDSENSWQQHHEAWPKSCILLLTYILPYNLHNSRVNKQCHYDHARLPPHFPPISGCSKIFWERMIAFASSLKLGLANPALLWGWGLRYAGFAALKSSPTGTDGAYNIPLAACIGHIHIEDP